MSKVPKSQVRFLTLTETLMVWSHQEGSVEDQTPKLPTVSP